MKCLGVFQGGKCSLKPTLAGISDQHLTDLINNTKLKHMQQNNGGHSLHAFTKDGDFIPTLYVVGQIKAKGDIVGIRLDEVAWSEQKPDTLGLKFVPDDYDSNGSTQVQITSFHKKLKSDGQYKNVVIESQQGSIHLEVERLKRGENPSFAGGGSEAPRG